MGYTKLNLAAGLNLVGIQFVDVGQSDAAVTSVAKLTGQATYNEDMDAQTLLKKWNGSGYDSYEWTGALSQDNPDFAAGMEEEGGLTGATTGAYDNKWFYAYEPTSDTDTIPAGVGFWIKASDSGKITFTRP